MCGRYTLTVSARVLAELFALDEVPELEARYNIAPTQEVPIVRASGEGGRQWQEARWGLIPSWAKDVKLGARMINARGETVAVKPAFRAAARHRRCLIPGDGFFEWKKLDGGKQPYYIHFRDGRGFAFAGLWERWTGPQEETVHSCTIITTRPNDVVAPLHDRMPVILPEGHFDEWLGAAELTPERLAELLVPHPVEGMEAIAVDRHVNSPRNDDPTCIRPLEQQALW